LPCKTLAANAFVQFWLEKGFSVFPPTKEEKVDEKCFSSHYLCRKAFLSENSKTKTTKKKIIY
jgi:hypothetical protein